MLLVFPLKSLPFFYASGEDYFKGFELSLAIPEYKVSLRGGIKPSHNDVFALLSSEKDLTAITVEGKVREDFGPTLAQWRSKVSKGGYRIRLYHIMSNTGLKHIVPEHIRYQLLHRTASAVIEAERFHSGAAAMIEQSFVDLYSENHFEDYVQFVQLYGVTPVKGNLAFLANIDGIGLHSAWVYTTP